MLFPQYDNLLIKGGSVGINTIFTEKVYRHILPLMRKYRIMFLDQLITQNGRTLLDWHAMRFHYGTGKVIPKWFKLINEIVINPQSHNLLKEYKCAYTISEFSNFEFGKIEIRKVQP